MPSDAALLLQYHITLKLDKRKHRHRLFLLKIFNRNLT